MPTQRQEISASIQANFPDNTSQFITPTRLRTEQGLFEQYSVLNEQTASIIAQAVASSSTGAGFVTTSSFNAYTSSTNTFTGSIQTQVNTLQAATGSYITNAQTSSMSVLSASFASTASNADLLDGKDSSIFATTGSNTFNGTNIFTGSVNIQSASITFLTVDTIVSSSTIFSSGSNTLGDAAGDTQTLFGTVDVKTGPLKVTGSVSATSGFTGSLQGTASFANNATSASYALNSTSASFAVSASYAIVASEFSGSLINTSASAVLGVNNATIIGGGGNLIESSSNSSIINGIQSKIFGYGAFDNFNSEQNIIINGETSVISGSNLSAIIGGNVRMNNLTSSVALGRTLPYTASANYTLFTQNIQSSGSIAVTGSLIVTDSITGSLQGTASFATTASFALNGGGGSTNTGSLLTTASVALNTITFTKGDGSTFPITVDTGSGGGGGMNLGANTFTGSQTIASSSVFINPTGSTQLYVTESAAKGNLIFGNTTLASSGSVIVTGSNNILLGAIVLATAQGGWNGSRNLIITSPQYSGSVPSVNGMVNLANYIASGSGTGTNSISSTFANGGITVTNTSPNGGTTISTSNINATTAIRHAASGSTASNGNLTISTTNLGGSVLISTTGSSTAAKTIAQSMFVGGNITASLEAASNSNLANTIVLGSGLVVSGTLGASSLSGSMIVGQYNETGSLSDPSQVKFVVGTGTSATSRRTSFFVSQSGETVAVNLVPTTLNTQNTTTIQSTGSITNRIHTKQSGAIAAGAISSSAFISPEIGLESTSANFKVILERNLTGSVGPSGSYAFSLDFMNTVLVSGGTDSYVGLGKINGFCLPGRRPTTPFATASIQNYINNDVSMLPTLSSSFDGTLYQVWAKHQGGASSSFAYTGQEFYHSGSTQ